MTQLPDRAFAEASKLPEPEQDAVAARVQTGDNIMPELSRFYGIIIRMFSEPSERHHVPHFHAYYGEHVAVFSISPVALIIGFVPQRQQRLIEAWAELHEEELHSDWQLLEQGRKPSPIAPLQ
jgi:hypothetical protein